MVLSAKVHDGLIEIFEQTHRQLRPRSPMPELEIEFFRFTNINHTIRLRNGRLLVRVSDLLEGAPRPVFEAIAHILLAKMYRQPVDRAQASHYRRYVSSHSMTQKAQRVRQLRGRKRVHSAEGRVYDLAAIFDQLNARFFGGLLARPRMAWSSESARNRLGHYDPAHNAIVISRVFDQSGVPRYAVDYIVYHEMLHLKHPVSLNGSRRSVHSREFQAEERQFPELEAARNFLRAL